MPLAVNAVYTTFRRENMSDNTKRVIALGFFDGVSFAPQKHLI